MTSSLYRVHIQDREYTSWVFVDPETDTPKTQTDSELLINPAFLKLFSGDLVDLSTLIPSLVDSPTKSTPIPGVLLLEGNQTYGRTANQKRLLYKCIPNNPCLPAFLVPYSPDIQFAKTQKNRYVVFQFDNWNSKHPYGILTENLGTTDHLPAFYEYQIYCRNLHCKINTFTVAAKKSINLLPELKAINSRFFENPPYPSIAPRIFSIDPVGAKDIDDAFSITFGSPSVATVRVYIANVYAWMETLNLWSEFGERISTIYLPGVKIPMIPSILSESVCSLTADGTQKLAFCMELRIDINNPLIIPGSVRFFNQTVIVDKNYSYESKELLNDADYMALHRCTKLIDPTIQDSHDVVSYWMVQMNTISAKWLYQRKVGIFREVSANRLEEPYLELDTLPLNTKTLLKNWRNTSGRYVSIRNSSVVLTTESIDSCLAKSESYVHITSPIRRLVDLLNQIIFQKEFRLFERTEMIDGGNKLSISSDAQLFLNTWQSRLPEINERMRSTKKIQIDCDLLYRCTAHPEWMQQSHRGIIFDRIETRDGNYSYTVHLSDLNILGRITSQEKYVNYQLLDFKLFVFQDSDKLNRKIRLTVVV